MSMRWRSLIANLISIIALWTNCNADPDVFSCFLLYSNRYLQRSGAVFIGNLSSPSECLERCLQANRLNFLECRSVMWRRDTNDCVLSRHRRSDRLENFHVAPNLEIDFYENICLSNDRNRVARRVNETKVIEKSFENNEWAKDQRTTIPIKEIDEKILKESINQIFVAASGFISSTPDPNSLVNVLSRKRAKVFASTQSVPLHPITLNDITGTTTIDSMPISNDFSGNSRRSHVEPSPIQPLVTNPLNRTALNLQKQMIDSPIRLNTFYKNSKKSIPFSSVESFDSRSNAVAVSGDTIPSKVSPIRTNVNTHAHVFRRKQNELTRNVRGSVILIPAKGANPSPPTIAPAITTNTIKAIRPGPITRHYYKPNTPFTTPTPLLSTQVVIDSEQEIDAEPLVVLNGQKRPAIVSSGFRATIMTSTTSSITTRSISFPTTISRATPSGKELAIVSDAPCFLKYSHRALPNYEEKALNGVSLRDCLVTCLYTSDLYCASVNYDFSRKICIVNGGSSSQTKTALQTSKTIDYYENVCPPAQPRTPDQLIIPSFIISRCLTPIVNTILEDLDASLVTSAQTLEECQSECLRGRGRRGKVCGGMNWIRATNGCMIFPPQYDRQQLSFAKDVTFFMNSCTEESFDEAKKEKTKNDYYEDFAQ